MLKWMLVVAMTTTLYVCCCVVLPQHMGRVPYCDVTPAGVADSQRDGAKQTRALGCLFVC